MASIGQTFKDDTCLEKLFRQVIAESDHASELLVALDRMDGEISEPDHEVLLEIVQKLGIKTYDFAQIRKKGLQRAKKLRKSLCSSFSKERRTHTRRHE